MSSISNETPFGDFHITSGGSLKFVQKWKFHFETEGGTPWNNDEKAQFKRLSILQVTATWDKRITINVTPLKHHKNSDLPKYPSHKKVTRDWHVSIVESGKPHWNIFAVKLAKGQHLQSPAGDDSGAYVMYLQRKVVVDFAAFNKNANDNNSQQSIMAHEFGHMLALANVDEYVSDNRKNFGDSGSILSVGTEPRARHLGWVLENYNSMVGNVGFSFGSHK